MKQLQTKTLTERAYITIKDSILKNEMSPGQSFSINSMAKALGISPTPIREAIARLSADGLVEGVPHKMLCVTKITREDVKQIYEARKLLEPHAAELAAKLVGSSTQLKTMLKKVLISANKILESEENQLKKEAFFNIDLKLNEIFLEAVTPFLREILDFVGERSLRIRIFVETSHKSMDRDLALQITTEHQEIAQAIFEGNVKKAKKSVLHHLGRGETRTLESIQEKFLE